MLKTPRLYHKEIEEKGYFNFIEDVTDILNKEKA
jgi:hypothetical protein